MNRRKREAWRGFSDRQAMTWALSAYLAAGRSMRPSECPGQSDFAERFIGELQARIYLDSHRRRVPVYFETPWNLPKLAAAIDPTFLPPELNDLPGAEDLADTAHNRGVRGG